MPKYIPVNNFKCKRCGEIRLSLHRHDFSSCRCGNFVDGGFDYCHNGGKYEDMEQLPLYFKKETK